MTPNGAKAQACLAMLATSANLDRSRAWLCEHLWSDRGHDQARGSLRQALMTIRQSFGAYGHALQANRTSVWLDTSVVSVLENGEGEFLEGMDIADAEWSDWLRGKRAESAYSHISEISETPELVLTNDGNRLASVVLSGGSSNKDDEIFIDGTLLEILSRNLSETSGIVASLDSVADRAIRLKLMSKVFAGGTAITASLTEQPTQRHLWSAQTGSDSCLPEIIADKDAYTILFQALDAIGLACLEKMSAENSGSSPMRETLAAAHQILSFDVERIKNACDVLDEICRSEAFAPAYGWLLFAIRANHYENSLDQKYTREEVEEICERALECGRSNAFVVSAVSATYLRLLDRFEEGAALAHRAFSLAPSNPFAIDALASAFYMGDATEKGYRLSRAAALLSGNTSFSSFFAMSQCVGATLFNRLDEAKKLAVSASAITPKLRSAWRFRLALAANSGDFLEAGLCRRMLERYESDFDLDRMLHDPAYPINSIRASRIDMHRIRHV